MKWHRIVLDEAQVIRNRLTQSAQCIFRLQTNYRWCLSGTPIFNGVSDIFSYLKICMPGTYSWDVFNRNVVSPYFVIGYCIGILYSFIQCQVERRDPARASKTGSLEFFCLHFLTFVPAARANEWLEPLMLRRTKKSRLVRHISSFRR